MDFQSLGQVNAYGSLDMFGIRILSLSEIPSDQIKVVCLRCEHLLRQDKPELSPFIISTKLVSDRRPCVGCAIDHDSHFPSKNPDKEKIFLVPIDTEGESCPRSNKGKEFQERT